MKVPISEIKINPGRREASPGDVEELSRSIAEIGLLNPITIDREHTLIAGLHRLEAVRLLGWPDIECTVSSLEGLQAELAEIDENFIRTDLSPIEFGELLLRRKEIYETLHPETKATYAGGPFKGNQHDNVVSRKMRPTTKSFAQDTADKLGVSKSTVERQIQTAKNLTTEAKEIIREADTKITKQDALKLSRLEPARQKEAAQLLASGELRSIDEYRRTEPLQEKPPPNLPFNLGGKRYATFEESVADLKNPDKDCSCTPDDFLAEITEFIKKFHRGIVWYSSADYTPVFPGLTPVQLDYLREQLMSICGTVKEYLRLVEGGQNNVQPNVS